MQSFFINSKKRYLALGSGLLLLLVFLLWKTGTLSYPGIMLQRQYQVLKYCVLPEKIFSSSEYGFSFAVPDGYCALPHRIFPRDGTVQIVPRGWYFVLNEYISGSISNRAIGTIIFFRDQGGAEISKNIQSLLAGEFATQEQVTWATSTTGLPYQYVENATGIVEGSRFDWAFAAHPNFSASFMALTDKPTQSGIFRLIIESIKPI